MNWQRIINYTVEIDMRQRLRFTQALALFLNRTNRKGAGSCLEIGLDRSNPACLSMFPPSAMVYQARLILGCWRITSKSGSSTALRIGLDNPSVIKDIAVILEVQYNNTLSSRVRHAFGFTLKFHLHQIAFAYSEVNSAYL